MSYIFNIPTKVEPKTTLLVESVKEGDCEAVKTMLLRGANPNAIDTKGFSPLGYAVFDNNYRMVEILVDQGARVMVLPTDNTELHVATYCPHEDTTAIIDYLLRFGGAKVDKAGERNRTPLHRAAQNGKMLVCRKLLQRKASPVSEDDRGLTPLELAAMEGKTDVLGLLYSRLTGKQKRKVHRKTLCALAPKETKSTVRSIVYRKN
jgi:ankyrin repeat protein